MEPNIIVYDYFGWFSSSWLYITIAAVRVTGIIIYDHYLTK